ncbi:hypothetical protein ABNF97_03155 [Plantactinospora sp. B6F1]|uniref:hypothetical protein n=1 Tax=Plantactinospora sp. B6F1 TaxID=3158971 RepID=UPI0032D99182
MTHQPPTDPVPHVPGPQTPAYNPLAGDPPPPSPSYATPLHAPPKKRSSAPWIVGGLASIVRVDIKVVSDQLGHSTTTITRDSYQHVRRAMHDGAVEAVVALLPERTRVEAAE